MTTLTVRDDTTIESHGTIIVFTGTDDTGRTVRFGVDHRPAGHLLDRLREVGELDVHVEGWQILGRGE